MRRCRPNYARLWSNRAKREDWESDFRGRILLQDGVSYFVGVKVRTGLNEEQYLEVFLRPDLATFYPPRTAACA
jgi:hypothetical protein